MCWWIWPTTSNSSLNFLVPVHNLQSTVSEPLDYFKLFFSDAFLDLIIKESNHYAEQQQTAKGTEDVYWKLATIVDIRKYIIIHTGYFWTPSSAILEGACDCGCLGSPELPKNTSIFSS